MNEKKLKKQEVKDILQQKYGIDIKNSTLQLYADKKLIEPGKKDEYGRVRGSVSYYNKNTPDRIRLVKYCLDKKIFDLDTLSKNLSILSFKDLEKLNEYYKEIFQSDKHSIITKDGKIRITPLMSEFIDYTRIAVYAALAELGIVGEDSEKHFELENSLTSINKDSKGGLFTMVELNLIKKKVIFKKSGIFIEEI